MFTPRSELYKLAQQCVGDSHRWFGDTVFNNEENELREMIHHALSLAGESGEVANIVKKLDRGSLSLGDEATRTHLENEVTDVFVYLLNLAGLLDMDLEKTYKRVRFQNELRFGEERLDREAARLQ